MDTYFEMTQRNQGYIPQDLQKKIEAKKVLIAGCGIGSQIAMALVRLGVTRFVLIDGDIVSASNLNRQSYFHHQLNQNKAMALAANMKLINPKIDVEIHAENLIDQTGLFAGVDIVLDTIDFLDLNAILFLHEEAEKQKIPLISGMSVGWGSCAIYFSNKSDARGQFRKIFGISAVDTTEPHSYVLQFAQLFKKLENYIDPQVVEVMKYTFTQIADGKPCPAPQVIGGSLNLASLVSHLFYRHCSEKFIPQSPYLIVSDFNQLIRQTSINLEKV